MSEVHLGNDSIVRRTFRYLKKSRVLCEPTLKAEVVSTGCTRPAAESVAALAEGAARPPQKLRPRRGSNITWGVSCRESPGCPSPCGCGRWLFPGPLRLLPCLASADHPCVPAGDPQPGERVRPAVVGGPGRGSGGAGGPLQEHGVSPQEAHRRERRAHRGVCVRAGSPGRCRRGVGPGRSWAAGGWQFIETPGLGTCCIDALLSVPLNTSSLFQNLYHLSPPPS